MAQKYLTQMMPVQLVRPGETFYRMANGQLEAVGTAEQVIPLKKDRQIRVRTNDGREYVYLSGRMFYVIRAYEVAAE